MSTVHFEGAGGYFVADPVIHCATEGFGGLGGGYFVADPLRHRGVFFGGEGVLKGCATSAPQRGFFGGRGGSKRLRHECVVAHRGAPWRTMGGEGV